MSRKLIRDLRPVMCWHEHVTASNVDLVLDRYRDRVARLGHVDLAGWTEDRSDATHLSRRQYRNFVANAYGATCNRPGKAAEIGIRPVDPLHRQAERAEGPLVFDVHCFKIFEQMRAVVPRRPFAET